MDRLIEEKKKDKLARGEEPMVERTIRALEELSMQLEALEDMKKMAAAYGFDIARPAENAREAVQWTYFGYLASIKEQNGAAMSLGRVSTFLDIYFERDLREGTLDETAAQEIMDDFVMKLRLARHLRTPEYNELFGGDPMWITESLGGIGEDGRPLVTKNCFRMLQTPLQPQPRRRAEPHGAVERSPAGKLEALHGEGFLRQPTPSSMKTTTSCARSMATTMPSPAASPR